MGIHGLWPLIKDKGYEPTILYPSTRASHLPGANSTIHVDLQACMFAGLRHAYSNHTLDVAHGIVESKLSQLVPKNSCVVYIDGLRCKEKQQTHASRDEDRKTSLIDTKSKIEAFAEMVNHEQKASKQTFVGIRKGLSKAFAWSTDAKESLVVYLQQKGWRVVKSTTESDLEIARVYSHGDIVATVDSDLMVYGNIETVWRPISGRRFLVYNIQEMVTALGINRVQLCALGIVSRNDYDCNIPSLGAATNFKIIKNLKANDAAAMVDEYLQNRDVLIRNHLQETFLASRTVFIELRQTPVAAPAQDSTMEGTLSHASLKRSLMPSLDDTPSFKGPSERLTRQSEGH